MDIKIVIGKAHLKDKDTDMTLEGAEATVNAGEVIELFKMFKAMNAQSCDMLKANPDMGNLWVKVIADIMAQASGQKIHVDIPEFGKKA
jgi:hypothetical protein